jgi:hypothetical protein
MNVLLKYLETLRTDLGPTVKNAIKDVIDEESNECFTTIKQGTPVSLKEHLHLVDTIKITKISNPNKYGWKIDYEGYNEKGIPYSLIARSLNKGSAFGEATHHIDVAVHNLKGLDERIDKHVEEELKKLGGN